MGRYKTKIIKFSGAIRLEIDENNYSEMNKEIMKPKEAQTICKLQLFKVVFVHQFQMSQATINL